MLIMIRLLVKIITTTWVAINLRQISKLFFPTLPDFYLLYSFFFFLSLPPKKFPQGGYCNKNQFENSGDNPCNYNCDNWDKVPDSQCQCIQDEPDVLYLTLICKVKNGNDRCSVGNDNNYDVAFQFSPVCPESFQPVCNPGHGGNNCEECLANKYSSDGTDCLFCPEGKTSTAGSPSCDDCSSGRYQGENNPPPSATCELCPANKYSSDGIDCLFCPAGETSTAESPSCDDCSSGRYQDENTPPPEAICKVYSPCPAGRKTSTPPTNTNNRVCTDCISGKYQTSNDFEGITCVSLYCQFFSQTFCFSFRFLSRCPS